MSKELDWKLDWEQELDNAGRTAFNDFQCGGDGLKKKESTEVLKTVYELHLTEQKNKNEAAQKKRESNIELANSIINGSSKLAMAGISGVGIYFGIKNMSKITALEDSYKVVSNRVFQWNLNQIIKPAMSAALQMVHF